MDDLDQMENSWTHTTSNTTVNKQKIQAFLFQQEIKRVVKNFPKCKAPRSDHFTIAFYQRDISSFFFKYFHKLRGNNTPHYIFEVNITVIPKPNNGII